MVRKARTEEKELGQFQGILLEFPWPQEKLSVGNLGESLRGKRGSGGR